MIDGASETQVPQPVHRSRITSICTRRRGKTQFGWSQYDSKRSSARDAER